MTLPQYITAFEKKHGRMPTQVELVKATGATPGTATQAIIKHVQDRRKGQAEQKQEAVKQVQKKAKLNKVILLLAVGFLLISTMATILSIYFTEMWFAYRFNPVISFIFSITMVLYMVLSPQASHLLNGFFLKTLLWVSFSIAITFSMYSTVEGQFSKRQERVIGTTDNSNNLFQLYQRQEAEKKQAIADLKREKEIHVQNELNLSYSEESRKENWEEIRTERNMVLLYTGKIEEAEELLSEIQGKLESMLSQGSGEVVTEKLSFYQWLAIMAKWDSNKIEFWVSVFPAVFIDLIAALSLNIAIMLLRRVK